MQIRFNQVGAQKFGARYQSELSREDSVAAAGVATLAATGSEAVSGSHASLTTWGGLLLSGMALEMSDLLKSGKPKTPEA